MATGAQGNQFQPHSLYQMTFSAVSVGILSNYHGFSSVEAIHFSLLAGAFSFYDPEKTRLALSLAVGLSAAQTLDHSESKYGPWTSFVSKIVVAQTASLGYYTIHNSL